MTASAAHAAGQHIAAGTANAVGNASSVTGAATAGASGASLGASVYSQSGSGDAKAAKWAARKVSKK